MKKAPAKLKKSAAKMKKAPAKFNAKLKAASAAGKLSRCFFHLYFVFNMFIH